MATIFKRNGKGNYIIQYFDHEGRRREKSSRTTDRRAAERIAAKIEAEEALRREGVVDARQERLVQENRRPLAEHIDGYFEHCEHIGQTPKHINHKRQHVTQLVEEVGASRLADITASVAEASLRRMKANGLSNRTVNFHRQCVVGFLNWCVTTGRIELNPLRIVPRLDQSRDRRRVRRDVSDDELARLMVVARKRGRLCWYLAAYLAGLRRSELMKLRWADVDLEARTLVVPDGKAKREDVLPVHPQLAAELEQLRPPEAHPRDLVFPDPISNKQRRRDFQEAGIPLVDEAGRFADLHSLRSSLATRLARQGVSPQICRQVMRHANYEVTLEHYTKLGLSDASGAISCVPRVDLDRPAVVADAHGKPQQIPQQSEHSSRRADASACEKGQRGGQGSGWHNPVERESLCEPVPSGAASSDDPTAPVGTRRALPS